MPCGRAVFADRLGDGEDVRLGKRAVERRAAMPAGAERDELQRIRDVGLLVVIVGEQFRHVDQERRGRRLAGEGERGIGFTLLTSRFGMIEIQRMVY